MIKLENGLLINEAQVVAAEFNEQSKTLKVTFVAAVTFGKRTADNQVLFDGHEAENLWRALTKGAQSVSSSPSASGGSSYAVGGKRNIPDLI